MARESWELWIGYLIQRKSRPQIQGVWAWISVLLATVPILLVTPFTMTLGPLGPQFWQLVFGGLSILAIVMISRTLLMAAAGGLTDLEMAALRTRLHWQRKRDWVPTNVADFVEMVCRKIETQSIAAAALRQENANAVQLAALRQAIEELVAQPRPEPAARQAVR